MTDTASEGSVEAGSERLVYEQLHQECLAYNRAIGSFNTHLDNHRERMDLHAIPFRSPVETPQDEAEMEQLLAFLLDQVHLDSQVRRHPDVAPIHEEAVEQVEIARRQLRTTLEEALPVA